MPTINAIVNQASMVSSVATKFFGANLDAANRSVLVGPAIATTDNLIKSDFGGQPALTNMIENYRESRESFNDRLKDNVDSVKESSDRLKETTEVEAEVAQTADTDNDNNTGSALSTLTGFANNNIPPEEDVSTEASRNEDETEQLATEEIEQTRDANRRANTTGALAAFAEEYLTAETEEEEDAAEIAAVARDVNSGDNRLNSVLNLVRDYNATVNYLNENRDLSNRMSALANSLSGSLMLSESLINMGISVNAAGELDINETLLTLALNRGSGDDEVNSILGSNGLAGQLDRNMDLVNAQGDRLFPSIADFANQNNRQDSESLYSARNLNTAAYARENVSRLFTTLT